MNVRPKEFEIGDPLGPEFFRGRCSDLSEALLGKLLLHRNGDEPTGGIIVETEAYLGENDPACHLANGRTKRTKPFFSGAGTVYVFKIYHNNNLNIITEYESHPECILVRSLRPTHGIGLMKRRRDTDDPHDLTAGPGKLTEALGIDKQDLNDVPLADAPLSIHETNVTDFEVVQTRRVGLSRAQDWLFRFCVRGCEWVSKPPEPNLDQPIDPDQYYRTLASHRVTTLADYR